MFNALLWLHAQGGSANALRSNSVITIFQYAANNDPSIHVALIGLINQLIKEGLVERGPMPENARASLTKLGWKVAVALVVASELEKG
jgi:hypothetical protein